MESTAWPSASESSGTYLRTGASRSTSPESASWITASAVIDLVVDPITNGVAAVASASPAVPTPTASIPPRVTMEMAPPGT